MPLQGLKIPFNRSKAKVHKLTEADHNHELKHTLPTPRYGYYFTHAHSHITPAVAALDSYSVLVTAHQHGITSTVTFMITDTAFTTEAIAKALL